VLSQQLQNAKMQADGARALKQADDLKPVFDQVYESGDRPAALQPLIPAADLSRSSWCRWVILSLSRVRR
jgi:hypothetical protein